MGPESHMLPTFIINSTQLNMKIKHLPKATPINGHASLRVTESITVPVYRNANAAETITSPAFGADGNTMFLR